MRHSMQWNVGKASTASTSDATWPVLRLDFSNHSHLCCYRCSTPLTHLHIPVCLLLQGPAGALAAAAPNLVQLDLTDNLLSSWDSVSQICRELPQLHVLQLSSNRLALPCSMCSGVQVLPGLQCLVLNQCSITWQQVRCGITEARLSSDCRTCRQCCSSARCLKLHQGLCRFVLLCLSRRGACRRCVCHQPAEKHCTAGGLLYHYASHSSVARELQAV
jgi:hypothetical protein